MLNNCSTIFLNGILEEKKKDCDVHFFNWQNTVFLGEETTNENAQANKQIW